MGQHDAAMAQRAGQHRGLDREIEGDGLDAIVINASGCGTTVKDYGFMFRTEPEPWRSRAAKISALACDITEFLARFGYAPTREAPGLTVAYHSACSLQHGQQVTAEPKALLQRAGFTRGRTGGAASLLRLGRHLQPAAAGDRRRGCASASWATCARRSRT